MFSLSHVPSCVQIAGGFFIIIQSLSAQCLFNADFELHDLCPTTWSNIDDATGWYSPTLGTTDYLNPCSSWFPHYVTGTGMAGFHAMNYSPDCFDYCNYHEYLAQCITFLPGTYVLSMDILARGMLGAFMDGCYNQGDIDIAVFVNQTCSFDSTRECISWQQAGAVTYSPDTIWKRISIHITVHDTIGAIAIGAACTNNNVNGFCKPYYFVDNISCGCTVNSDCDDNSNCTIDWCIEGKCWNQNAYLNGSLGTFEDWHRNCCRCN